MSNHIQPSLIQQRKELDEPHYTTPRAVYEAALQLAIVQLEQPLPPLKSPPAGASAAHTAACVISRKERPGPDPDADL